MEPKNKHKSMLIIGRGDTSAGMAEIERVKSTSEARKKFGDSDLYIACSEALDFGAPYVYTINTPTSSNILDVINALKGHSFTYIVPVNVFISDYFHNKKSDNKRMYYLEYLLKKLPEESTTTIVATDKHASLYGDIDHFLQYIVGIKNNVRSRLINDGRVSLRNLCFVANNLKNYKFSNAVLAASLCSIPVAEYPTGEFGPALFELDSLDLEDNEIIYFKNNYRTGTTVENLVNFEPVEKIVRNLMADRIAKYIKNELNLERFKGRLATNYQRLKAEQEVVDFLEKEKGRTLENYSLSTTELFKNAPGAKELYVEFDIYPFNYKDKIAVRVKT